MKEANVKVPEVRPVVQERGPIDNSPEAQLSAALGGGKEAVHGALVNIASGGGERQDETSAVKSETTESSGRSFEDRVATKTAEAQKRASDQALAEMRSARRGEVSITMREIQETPALQAEYALKYAEKMQAERVRVAKEISFEDYVAEHPMPEDTSNIEEMNEWSAGAEEHYRELDQAIRDVPTKDELQAEATKDDTAEEGEENAKKPGMREAFKLAFRYLTSSDENKKEVEKEVQGKSINDPDFRRKFNIAKVVLVSLGMATMTVAATTIAGAQSAAKN